ncbi:hypothetical protein DFA_01550 [Cavenderia fasciculata]|uniref:MYND-type domain-containing protein n=1 Tax=Cavenderia fasciculata TaxID=261658 RepID=F4PTE2_CACFS|nr:uncharacterized protein DFA_01550 [Cavenderia fasciculata]EGG21664.1 hypothetical protein DFA_01550 [Cavenderia fasciculata]|eukprot:XP_004359514.1 hypothetical protein DFA_01550 [Cavenderia fasciculata]
MVPPILNNEPNTMKMGPKEYLNAIQPSGMPKIEYIMSRYSASTNELVVERSPPVVTKPRSVSLPNRVVCLNCKQCYNINKCNTCDRCSKGFYCSDECKYAHWPMHRKNCVKLEMVIKLKRKTF